MSDVSIDCLSLQNQNFDTFIIISTTYKAIKDIYGTIIVVFTIFMML